MYVRFKQEVHEACFHITFVTILPKVGGVCKGAKHTPSGDMPREVTKLLKQALT